MELDEVDFKASRPQSIAGGHRAVVVRAIALAMLHKDQQRRGPIGLCWLAEGNKPMLVDLAADDRGGSGRPHGLLAQLCLWCLASVAVNVRAQGLARCGRLEHRSMLANGAAPWRRRRSIARVLPCTTGAKLSCGSHLIPRAAPAAGVRRHPRYVGRHRPWASSGWRRGLRGRIRHLRQARRRIRLSRLRRRRPSAF